MSTKNKKVKLAFDEEAAAEGYRVAHEVAVRAFGADYVRQHPSAVFFLHDALPEGIEVDEEALVRDLQLARDLMEHFAHKEAQLPNIAFGIYDRVLGADATGMPEHLEAAQRVAEKVFGGAVSIDAIFEVFDREFGSPYEE